LWPLLLMLSKFLRRPPLPNLLHVRPSPPVSPPVNQRAAVRRTRERLSFPSALSLSRLDPFVARTAVPPQHVKRCVCPQHRALRRGLASVQDVAPWVTVPIRGSRPPKLRDEPREIVSRRATRRPRGGFQPKALKPRASGFTPLDTTSAWQLAHWSKDSSVIAHGGATRPGR
jgi:hypothetical protein